MKLLFSDQHPLSSDAFGAAVLEDVLCVPVEFRDLCNEAGVDDAAGLLSLFQAFPQEVYETIDWPKERFDRAYVGFAEMLEGELRDTFFDPLPPRIHPLGALAPPDHPVQIGYMVPDEDLEG